MRERDEILARFRGDTADGLFDRQPLKFLCNVNVLTTGFDAPKRRLRGPAATDHVTRLFVTTQNPLAGETILKGHTFSASNRVLRDRWSVAAFVIVRASRTV